LESKILTAERAAEFISDGMTVGLGAGSTIDYIIKKLGEKVRKGFNIKVIPSSKKVANLCKKEGIQITGISSQKKIDLTIHETDKIDKKYNFIKDGGSLLREKIIAFASDTLIVIANESDFKNNLNCYTLPIEIIPFSWKYTKNLVENLGCSSNLRKISGKVFITDNNNYILDCNFGQLRNYIELTKNLNVIPGVLENGLFINLTDLIVVKNKKGRIIEIAK
jgi:ribose 5-phosphate isomerase A